MADSLGRPLTGAQFRQLELYRDWLVGEAFAAGGIGPRESARIDERHIADSFLYSRFLDDPAAVWDLGTGVGLPGIPLAVLMPDTPFTLVDRSGRRVDLAKRAVRIMDLANVTVRQSEIERLEGPVPAIVTRASLSPRSLEAQVRRLLTPGGVAVVGGSWVRPPRHPGWSTEEVGRGSLDRPVWLLIMRQQ